MPTEPAPIAVDPSGDFLGNDGAWSTFAIDVGTPPQTLQFVPSTQQPASWAVGMDGCGDDDVANCTDARGGLFDSQKSSSWFRKDVYGLGEANNLGYDNQENNGTYGFDTMILKGQEGDKATLDHQVIAATVSHKFYLGSLGLNPQQVNFTNSGDSSPSLLSSLKAKNMIPSLSFGYTAGASYKQKGASLTLGGHDTSRYKPNDVSFNFAPTVTRQLVVGLQGISFSDGTSETSLLKEGILALVDSTVPYLWLPQSTCQLFEKNFGIKWDPLRNLYLVNDTVHDDLVKSNPSVTFSLANSASGGGSTANVTLPYAAFDLTAQPPLVKNSSRYFPLQRAPDESSFTLGRTFLQEAYMVTNYEDSTFTISQAISDSDAPMHIVAITSNTTGGAAGSPSGVTKTKGSGGGGGIGTGAIAGVAIAIALVGIIVAIVAFVCIRRRRRAKRAHAEEPPAYPPNDETKTVGSTVRSSVDEPEPKKEAVNVGVDEVMMTPPVEMPGHYFGAFGAGEGPSRRPELAGEPFSRSELSTPEPYQRSELPSPGLGNIRSELSTPEPVVKPELPSPDPSAELPSPSLRAIANPPSPEPGSKQRPHSERMDSSESESGFTRDGLGIGNFRQHQRYNSDSPRPKSFRQGSEDSIESPILPPFSPTDSTNPASPTFSETPVSTLPPRAYSGRSRPQARRADSDTWETRMELNSDPPTRSNTTKQDGQKPSEPEDGPVSPVSNSLKEASQGQDAEAIPVPDVPERALESTLLDAKKASGVDATAENAEGPVLRKPVPIRASLDGNKKE